MVSNLRLTTAGLSMLLASCGSGGGFDPKRAVEALPGFQEPFVVWVPLNAGAADLGGNCVAAKLADEGKLTFAADVSGPPYWTPALVGGSAERSGLSIPVGPRQVTSVAERRDWKEGAVAYRAATVTYEIVDDGLFGQRGRKYGPISARLVFENDPATNRWVLSPRSPEQSPTAELLAVANQDTANSTCNATALVRGASNAREEAFAEMERNLAANRGIKRTSTPNIIESATIGRQLYLGTASEPALVDLPITEIVPKARQLCADLRARGHSDWRLGTFADMRSVTDVQAHDVIRVPVDVPDGRIWKPFLQTLGLPTPVYMPVSDAPAQNWGPFAALAVGSGTRFSENNLVMGFQIRRATYRLFCVRDT